MSTSLVPVIARTSLTKAQGTDIAGLPGLLATMQALADRTEWASKALIVPYSKTVDMAGTDYPSTTSYAVLGQALSNPCSITVANAAVGDIVLLGAMGQVESMATETYDYSLQLFGESQVSVGLWGYNGWPNMRFTWHLSGIAVVATAGSRVYSVRGKTTNNGLDLVDYGSASNPVRLDAIHIRLGAA